jgi:hypothetical protein
LTLTKARDDPGARNFIQEVVMKIRSTIVALVAGTLLAIGATAPAISEDWDVKPPSPLSFDTPVLEDAPKSSPLATHRPPMGL